jgi:ubiquinone/menaquinone biosynthesis C-methylase UbiE
MKSPTKRFSDRVSYYVRSRPKYPAALLRFFQSELGLSPEDSVADIGSGTGFLTELFVRNGNPTFAVEPNQPMRTAAEEYLAEWSNFHSIDGTAENTTLPDASVALITAGQAAHWFNMDLASKEFVRILKPGGYVALVWNERVVGGSPFMDEYEKLVERYGQADGLPRVRQGDAGGDGSVQRLFGLSGYQVRQFENPQMLDREGMIDRLTSSSYMPLPADAGYAEMIKSAQALFDKHQQNQSVRILHEARVYFGILHT